MIAKSTEEFW
jgi:hypothetical protein